MRKELVWGRIYFNNCTFIKKFFNFSLTDSERARRISSRKIRILERGRGKL